MPSVTLQKPEDKATIKKALSGNKILTATVARLYIAYPDPNAWAYTKIMGAVGFVKDNSKNSFFFKIVDLLGDRGIIWEQELYKDFQYTEETQFFHTFALDEYLAAFSFANEQEAKSFYKKVINREKLPSKSKKSQKENKNSGGGLFGGGKKKKKKNKIDKSEIGAPTEFRHLGHIGWDEQKGFDVQNINPEWRDLIDQLGDLGISKEMIVKNTEFISDFLEKSKNESPRKQAKKGPPPQPPSRRTAPPPPKRKSPPPPPARKPVTGPTTPIRDTLQPSSPAKVNSVSPPVSPSFLPKITPAPAPPPTLPPPISAPSIPHTPPVIPPTIPSRSTPQQPVVAPPPPPPPVRPPTFNNTPPPIPPARVTNSNPAPPPLPPTRPAPQLTAPLPPPPPPPPVGGPPPPPPLPSGGPPPPTTHEAPQIDTRANLMEAIRNRGGVSGGGLRSVGEPTRQSTFTEEPPSSPGGNDTNLAKTLADALKKLNKDLGSDESDEDDDDEWDTE